MAIYKPISLGYNVVAFGLFKSVSLFLRGSFSMCTIGLISKSKQDAVTAIPNRFIDDFMVDANGTYVKVYLYLLRHLTDRTEFSVPQIAELLDCTENFLLKALHYWSKQGILEFSVSGNGTVESINLVDLTGGVLESKKEPSEDEAVTQVPVRAKSSARSGQSSSKFSSAAAAIDIDTFAEDTNVPFLLSTLEQYFKRPLSREDTDTALYIYGRLGFSCELVFFLYERCIMGGKTSARYIGRVAESWSEAGVSTVEEAENLLLTESDAFRAVCREFGIDGTPGASQIRYIRTWAREWHLPAEVIREACARTMTRKGPNFPYANTILKEWHEADVKSSEDIAKRDEDHRQAEAKKHPAVTRDDRKKSRTDRFGDFTQREYSAETLAEIEKKMRQR